jgi:hypothetical protein
MSFLSQNRLFHNWVARVIPFSFRDHRQREQVNRSYRLAARLRRLYGADQKAKSPGYGSLYFAESYSLAAWLGSTSNSCQA